MLAADLANPESELSERSLVFRNLPMSTTVDLMSATEFCNKESECRISERVSSLVCKPPPASRVAGKSDPDRIDEDADDEDAGVETEEVTCTGTEGGPDGDNGEIGNGSEGCCDGGCCDACANASCAEGVAGPDKRGKCWSNGP